MNNTLRKVYWAYRNKISNKLWGVVHMPATGKIKGNILLSYITEPFTKTHEEQFSTFHTNYWECYEMARLFSERGYAVDIINWNNHTFTPRKYYRVCIDIQSNLELLHLPNDCRKVMHIVGSYSDFQNKIELKRLEVVRERRGIILSPHRQVAEAKDPGAADYLEGFGNKAVHATYARFSKPIVPIPISAVKLFDFPEHKDFRAARANFLWFGGGGAVLKGLDLVLEAFVQNPGLTLHVCGPVAAEKDFSVAYKKELYETANIHYHGRINVDSDLFKKVADACGALIYPAFSEGTSGSVVQAMHAGVAPILTPQAGIYEDADCIVIEEPTVDSISEAIRSFAALSSEEVYKKAHAAWAYARAHYTRESFSNAYANFIDDVLKL
jgi:glycosyltransferase involved in cell wall biosynthesis